MEQTTKVYKPGEIASSNLQLAVPVKVGPRYVAQAIDKSAGGPVFLHFSPPVSVVDLAELPDGRRVIELELPEQGLIRTQLETVRERLLEIAGNNSADFFGQSIGLNHLKASALPTFSDAGVLSLDLAEDVLVRDQYETDRKLDDIKSGERVSPTVEIVGLSFGRKTIKLELLAHLLRIRVKRKPAWSPAETKNDPSSEGAPTAADAGSAPEPETQFFSDSTDHEPAGAA
jgi:hypothetical protein